MMDDFSSHDLHLLGIVIKAVAMGVLIAVVILLVREAYFDSRKNCAVCNEALDEHSWYRTESHPEGASLPEEPIGDDGHEFQKKER